MKIIDFYFYVLNEIILLTNNKIEAEAEAELIFGSKKFKKYFGKSLFVLTSENFPDVLLLSIFGKSRKKSKLPLAVFIKSFNSVFGIL